MTFSIKWASVAVAYVGMAFGAWQIWQTSASPVGWLFGIGVGMLFGGGIALPFVVSNFAAALLAAYVARGRTFGAQFALFTLLSCFFGVMMMRWLDRLFQGMGGSKVQRGEVPMLTVLVLATFAVAFLLMKVSPDRRAA